MPALLLSAIPWRLVAILGLCAGLLLGAMWVTSQIKKVGKLEAQLDQAIEVSNTNAEIARKAAEDYARINSIMLEGSKAKAAIRTKADARRTKIYEAPETDDGPLAPILRGTLDGLPESPSDEVSPGKLPRTTS